MPEGSEHDAVAEPPSDGQPPPAGVVAPAAAPEEPVGELGIAVSLDQFSGPMDLLLYLVRRLEVDVRDLPITAIADQFATWVSSAADLDLEQAGDFVVMAATLLEIKARMVAPPPAGTEVADDGEDEYDPRSGLIRRLLVYRAAKEAAFDLDRRDAERRLRHERGHREVVPDDPGEIDAWELKDVDVGALATLWFDLLKRIDGLGPRTVIVDDMPMGVRMAQLAESMRSRGEGRLSEFFALEPGKIARVGLVMAVLESTRQRFIQIRQGEQYGDVLMRFRPEDERAVVAGDPGPPEQLPKRQRRPPLVTWSQADGAAAEVADAEPGDEPPPENEEQRFLRELEQGIGVERLLSRFADLEAGFISWWEDTYPGQPLPPGVIKAPPPPPPPPPEPPKPEPVLQPAAEQPAKPKRSFPRPRPAAEAVPPAAVPPADAVPAVVIPDPSPEPVLAIPLPSPVIGPFIPDPLPGQPDPPTNAVAEAAAPPAAAEATVVAEKSGPLDLRDSEPTFIVEPLAATAPPVTTEPAPDPAVAAVAVTEQPEPSFAIPVEPPATVETLAPPASAPAPEPPAVASLPTDPVAETAIPAEPTPEVEAPQASAMPVDVPEPASEPTPALEAPLASAEPAVAPEPTPALEAPLASAASVDVLAPTPVPPTATSVPTDSIADAAPLSEPMPEPAAPDSIAEVAPSPEPMPEPAAPLVPAVVAPEASSEAPPVASAPAIAAVEPAPTAVVVEAPIPAPEPQPALVSAIPAPPEILAPVAPVADPAPAEVVQAVADPPPAPPPDPAPPPGPPPATTTSQTAPPATTPILPSSTPRPMPRPRHIRIAALIALNVLVVAGFFVWFYRPASVLALAEGPDGATVSRDGEVAWTLNLPLGDLAKAPLPQVTPAGTGTFAWRDARTVVFTPAGALPADASLSIAFPPELRAAGSFRFPDDAAPVRTLRTLPALSVRSATASAPAFGDASVVLALNRQPAAARTLIDGVAVSPAVPFTATMVEGGLRLTGAFVPGASYRIQVAAVPGRADDQPTPWTGEVAIPARIPGVRLQAGVHRLAVIEAVGIDLLVVEAGDAANPRREILRPQPGSDGIARAEVPAWLLEGGDGQLAVRWSGGSASVQVNRHQLRLDPADLAPLLMGGTLPVVSAR